MQRGGLRGGGEGRGGGLCDRAAARQQSDEPEERHIEEADRQVPRLAQHRRQEGAVRRQQRPDRPQLPAGLLQPELVREVPARSTIVGEEGQSWKAPGYRQK